VSRASRKTSTTVLETRPSADTDTDGLTLLRGDEALYVFRFEGRIIRVTLLVPLVCQLDTLV
jgi:hypothetical protein